MGVGAPCDITVVMTAHHEGRLAHHTMRSLFRARTYAVERGISVATIVVLDRPDEATERHFSSYAGRPDIVISRADYGDLGLSRNHGISLSAGTYVAILDADNLFCLNWLFDAAGYLGSRSAETVVHPEYQMVFEAQNFAFRQISSTDPSFEVRNLIEYNYWDAVCMARREVFVGHPYESTTSTEGFGFEDWHWNCETLADGIEHHVVPGTVHFMRMKKSGSLLAYTRGSRRLIRPSKLFDPQVLSRAVQEGMPSS